MAATTKEIALKLLIGVLSFYSVYYIAASLLHGIFVLENFDGKIPFHYQSYDSVFHNKTVWQNPYFLSDFLAMECTFVSATFVFLTFMRSGLWDYAVTITLLHCGLVCLVNLTFPLVWEWWLSVLIGMILMISAGELMNCYINRLKTGKFSPNRDKNTIS
ncbi:putative transmembrane protein 244 [Amphiura filiformis]|uniref:putative transmembrane protein 244 n=1 Tax=Amphiura filiformis TaxID=82378 RepID=UPI003B224EB8